MSRLVESGLAGETSAHLPSMDVVPGLARAATPEVFALAARDARVGELTPGQALQVQLVALLVLAPITEASVWLLLANGRVRCVEHRGSAAPSRRIRRAAFDALHGRPLERAGKRIRIHAVPMRALGRTRAALVVRSHPGDQESAIGYAEEGAQALAPTLERQVLLDRLEAQRRLSEAAERRITRVGLDLHDGPLQHLSVLMSEIALLRRQLIDYEERLLDQEKLARSVDQQLRQLIAALPPISARGELDAVLQRQIRVFGRGSDIPVRFTARGTARPTTQSQRIALARVVQEALANIGRHSGATSVEVSLVYGRSAMTLRVVDNGRGFDARANGDGRLGLTSMAERIQLLDGVFEIESRAGGPTVVSAVLPRFEPDALGERGEPEDCLLRSHG